MESANPDELLVNIQSQILLSSLHILRLFSSTLSVEGLSSVCFSLWGLLAARKPLNDDIVLLFHPLPNPRTCSSHSEPCNCFALTLLFCSFTIVLTGILVHRQLNSLTIPLNNSNSLYCHGAHWPTFFFDVLPYRGSVSFVSHM